MSESIPDYRKIVLLMFLIENGSYSINESGFLKKDTNCLNKEFRNNLLAQNEEDLDYIKNEEKSIIERILTK